MPIARASSVNATKIGTAQRSNFVESMFIQGILRATFTITKGSQRSTA